MFVECSDALSISLDHHFHIILCRHINNLECALLVGSVLAEAVLRPVFNELCFNLESFNPAFAACVLQVSSGLVDIYIDAGFKV